MLQNKLKGVSGNTGFGIGSEAKKKGGSHFGGIVESIKKHTQELFDLQNEDTKSKKSKQQAN